MAVGLEGLGQVYFAPALPPTEARSWLENRGETTVS